MLTRCAKVEYICWYLKRIRLGISKSAYVPVPILKQDETK
jgi:hypothetical protein